MKILHYSLGLPPYRTGGMTKFCTDLISRQVENGDTVALIWPGKISVASKKVKIEDRNSTCGIRNFEIINPLPIPLNGGIRKMEDYTAGCLNPDVYEEFLEDFKPDAIHIHTLMGLHKEFVSVAKAKGIKIVFTSHDYFGICPKVTMFHDGAVCDTVESCEHCTVCNKNALDMRKIMLLQSPTYRKVKDWSLVKAFRKSFKTRFFKENHSEQQNETKSDRRDEYINLRKYYLEILQMIDVFHFNSSVAKKVYEQYVPGIENKGTVINISHKDIGNNKRLKTFTDTVNITYLAPAIESKGYKMLISVLDEMWAEGERWFKLNLYDGGETERPYVTLHKKYNYKELEDIFEKTDVLAAPSLWYETFGYTVLEALSFGVPVVITENVGAKDLLKDRDFGLVVQPEKDALKQAIMSLTDTEKLIQYNENIVNAFNVEENISFYNKIRELY